MSANNSGRRDPAVEAKEGSAKIEHLSACESVMNKLAIEPGVAHAMKLLPLLCTRCQQNLQELLTTQGLGVARLKADLGFALRDGDNLGETAQNS